MSLRETEWIHQYDMLKHKIRDKRQSGNPCHQSEIKDLNTNVDFLVKGLKMMQSAPMEYEISSSELARREIIADNLRKQITMIPIAGKKLGATSPAFGIEMEHSSSNGSVSSNNPNDTMNPMNTSDKGLVQRQKDIIKLQDDIIEDISRGVDVLHHQAIHIGEEAKVHGQLLEQLDGQVDKAADGLKQEARHADEVRIKSNVCGLYMCVVVEVVIIVILLIVWLGIPGSKTNSN